MPPLLQLPPLAAPSASTPSATPSSSDPSSAEEAGEVLTMSCLGSLGQFGNQIFQYAFLKLFSELRGASIVCPDWIGRRAFALHDPLPPREPRLRLPFVADRVVLSHRGWRRWASEREPLASLLRANGGKALSGRALRRDFPQVSGDALSAEGARRLPRGSYDLCGWFQFHTSVWAAHTPRLRELFTPEPALRAALEALLLRLRRGGEGRTSRSPLAVLHLRVAQTRGGEARGEALHAGGGWVSEEWEDRYTFWCAPHEWFVRWVVAEAAAAAGGGLAVVICSDCPHAAEHIASRLPSACCQLRWEDVKGSAEWQAVWEAWRAVFDGHACEPLLRLFLDWWVMTQADRLAISNSTFSFTAAMLNAAGSQQRSVAERAPAFYRPVPEAGGLESFDPWDSKPLLTCAPEHAKALFGGAGSYS
ncbi:hypothetical protein AB1Y20_018565 [Prymnesium parvum]|uniref:Uncharacterized protein n=1 Tax=Prymnesium parvum TaxID=97485 RepID=A0AB34JST1_PRYPA